MINKKFLMCPPHFYDVSYEINPWMSKKDKPQINRAIGQWSALVGGIITFGGMPVLIDPKEHLPDMVFTANAGLPVWRSKTFIVSKFKCEERQGEQTHWEDWFTRSHWKIAKLDEPFEGAGDALYLCDHLICGYGFRTTREAYNDIGIIAGCAPILVELQDPRFYHLDTCFCPLQNGRYLIYEGAFKPEDVSKLKNFTGGRGISVPEEEALNFACNAICIGHNVILPKDCPQTYKALESKGYNPVPISMDQYIKSGGACKCLTLEI